MKRPRAQKGKFVGNNRWRACRAGCHGLNQPQTNEHANDQANDKHSGSLMTLPTTPFSSMPQWLQWLPFALMAGLLLGACGSDEAPTPAKVATTPADNADVVEIFSGFQVTLEGAVNTTLNSPGRFSYLPPRGQREGYFFINDGDDENGIDVNIIVPRLGEPGTWTMFSASPHDIGLYYEGRVEISDGDRYQYGAEGLIRIGQMARQADGSMFLSGSFRFTTHNSEGKPVAAEGMFGLVGEGMPVIDQ